jgi:hypothetical protein
MDWIFEHFQIVILILLGVGSMLKSVLESKNKDKSAQEEEQDDPGEVFAPDEDYTSPRESNVPPPLTRQAMPPPLRERGYDEMAAMEVARALKHQQDLAERLRHIRETKATTSGGAAATRARESGVEIIKNPTSAGLSVRARLRSPAELRQAFVIREILNAPVGLR